MRTNYKKIGLEVSGRSEVGLKDAGEHSDPARMFFVRRGRKLKAYMVYVEIF